MTPKKSILIRIDPKLKIKVATKLVKDDGVSFQSICEKALKDYANAIQCPNCSTSMTHVVGYKYNCHQCEKTFKI